MKTKLLSITLIGLLAISLGSWTSMNTGATTTPFNYSIPFNASDVYVPCTDELVDFTGSVHIHGNTVMTPNGNIHVNIHQNLQGVSGIGQTSGDSYNYIGAYHEHFNGVVGETYSQNLTSKIISNGTQWNHLHNYHVTVNANGETTVEFYTHVWECN